MELFSFGGKAGSGTLLEHSMSTLGDKQEDICVVKRLLVATARERATIIASRLHRPSLPVWSSGHYTSLDSSRSKLIQGDKICSSF